MNFVFRYILMFLLLFTILACVTDTDIELSGGNEKLVMLGMLHPDSIISVRILKTLPALSGVTKYPIVEDAEVSCYTGENETYLGTLRFGVNGRYTLPVKPQYGEKYTIKVKVGSESISASDYLPVPVVHSVTLLSSNSANPNRNPDILVDVKGKRNENEVVWITTTLRELKYGSDSTFVNSSNSILTSSPLADGFNSSILTDYPQRQYKYLLRLKPEFSGPLELRFTIFNSIKTAIRQKGSITVKVLTTSANYDKYMKSAFISTTNLLTSKQGQLVNPFYEPTNTFSNVNNGLGIFGAMVENIYVFDKLE
jgi:hypothetical protein